MSTLPDGFPGSRVRHGTPSGYRLHQKHDEKPCDACTSAKADYDRRRLESPERTRLNRARASAQMKAYGELSRRHKDEYDALYREYRDRILGEVTS